MTDDTITTDGGSTDGVRSRTRDTDDDGGLADLDVRRSLSWLALGVLTLLALLALANLYTNVSEAISLWLAAKYEPVVQALFALVVLSLSVGGIASLTRELS